MTISDPLRLVGSMLAHKYSVESLVRVEAGSVVYRALQVATNRSVAVRVLTALAIVPETRRMELHDSLVRDHAKLLELAAIAPAAHPISAVGTVTTPHGAWVPYAVLAWPHGLTLEQALASPHGSAFPDSLGDVASMLEPIAVALAVAHDHGVVHGAITAERVLLREENESRRAILLDFGVARVLRAMEDEPTPRDDVRALAGVLSQAVARACGADASAGERRTPRSRGVIVEHELEALFARAFSPESFAHVGDFWSALRRSLNLAPLRSMEATLPPELPPSSSTSRSLRPTSRSTPPPPPTPPKSPRSRMRSATLYGATGAALTALVVATLGLSPSWRTSAAPSAAAANRCEPSMVAVSASTYRAGVDGDPDDAARDVSLHGFCLDRDAVTTRSYKACSDRGNCKRASRTNEWDGIDESDHAALDPLCRERDSDANAAHPINCVTWEMASAYCAERGARLPTEAEWEIASRATGASIAEWVGDWRAPIAAGEPQVDPRGPAQGVERVVRGAHAAGAQPPRFGAPPSTRSHAIGFRCARSL